MSRKRVGTLFEFWVPAALIVGIAGILVGRTILTGIGVVLVILGLISLMPALRYTVLLESAPKD